LKNQHSYRLTLGCQFVSWGGNRLLAIATKTSIREERIDLTIREFRFSLLSALNHRITSLQFMGPEGRRINFQSAQISQN
jgi:hypothetical protein